MEEGLEVGVGAGEGEAEAGGVGAAMSVASHVKIGVNVLDAQI